MATVVLIHGLYLGKLSLSLLRRRIAAAGFRTTMFGYPTVHRGLQENAARLQAHVAALGTGPVHLVAHSLGGLLVRQWLADYPQQCAGRVVTLGTPHQGSALAQRLAGNAWTGWLLGKSLRPGLLGGLPEWPDGYELGSLAGTLSVGMSWFVPGLARPNDGTVAVAETRLSGMHDHFCLRVSHTGLLLSPQAARQAVTFLQTGHFTHAA